MSIPKVFVRAPYNYDVDVASNESGLSCNDPSLTQQHFAEECDINTIVDRFMKTGVMPEGIVQPQYGDYSEVMDFQSAQNAIRSASENFFAMPAAIRARFQNSPQVFLEFFGDPANQDEAIKLGLATRRPGVDPSGSAPGPASKPDGAAAP